MEGTPGQVCAALLPCAAGFTGAMAEPSPKSSHPVIYQKWLEFYERPEQFSFSSALVRTFENEMAEAPATEIAHCKMIFTRSVQHQISVLDAAWRTEDRWE
jgi:thiaminase